VRPVPAFVALAGLALAAMAAVAWLGLRQRPRPADLIVVLGAELKPDRTPSARLVARLQCGREAWGAGLAPAIMVSGGPERGTNEAPVMAAWLAAHGVPAPAIVVDPAGANTWLTAIHARAWLTAHGARRALVVSQYFHLPRCRLAFARLGVSQVSAAAPRWYEARDLFALAREVPALVKYALRPLPRDDAARP
jgi:uncharacterized SAM-binding protein YcdF (DUF218 family)